MKKTILLILCAALFSCEKEKTSAAPVQNESVQENYGPYGKISNWVCISGDSIFADTLTLTYFYTEKCKPMNKYYYQQSYSLFNDFSYTLWANDNVRSKDTLTIVDTDTGFNSTFKRQS